MEEAGCGEGPDAALSIARLRALADAEDLYRPRSDYMDKVQKDGMTTQWRPKIMAWFGQLGESFKLKSETLSMATNYLDRYLSRRSCGNVSFQLASIASIFLASKIEETRPFRTSDFVTLSDGLFSASDLRLMELELLCTLQWHLNPPTAHAAVHLLVSLLGDEVNSEEAALVGDRACHYADLGREDSRFLKYPPSMVAVAAVICALKRADAPVERVNRWMARVDAARLPYAAQPDAAREIMACGLELLALDGDAPTACDAEVEDALASDPSSSPSDASSSDDEAASRDRTSPNNVMDVDAHAAFGAPYFFPAEKPPEASAGIMEG